MMSLVKTGKLNNRYPDFILVGAMKTGTTSIYNALKKHPEIFCSPLKEPNYFCTDISDLVKEKGDQWHIKPIQSRDDLLKAIKRGSICEHVLNKDVYLSLFENALDDQVVGEFSVSYMRSITAASEIRKKCPDARIIMVLRNPIDRAYSEFLMTLMLGLENCTFSEMVAGNIGMSEPHRFLTDGLYYEQVKRYLDIFPREQVLILLQEELRQDFSKSIAKVCEHIGVNPVSGGHPNPESFVGKVVRYKFINNLMYTSGFKRLMSAVLPKPIVNYGKSFFFKKRNKNDCMNERDRILLSDFYKNDLKKLCDLIDRDLSYWLDADKK